ncbi:MAG: sialate O-acetylesterase [Rariglobus sp.]
MPLPRPTHLRALFTLATLAFATSLHAASALKPNFLFSDNMVLQRDRAVPVWGEAPAGTQVRVSLLGKSASATAGPDGKWAVQIGPFPAGGPHELLIESSSEKHTVKNVLVGDVWFCSGQSNMWWSVTRSKDGAKEIPLANYPKIRLITIPQRSASVPKSDLEGVTWSECTPETVKEFSAVAYYFGRALQQHNDVPVALINSSWGGSAIQSWTSLASLETNPDLVGITAPYYHTVRRFDKDLAAGIVDERDAYIDKGPQPKELGLEAPALDDSAWKEWAQPGDFGMWGKPEYVQGGIWFRRTIDIPAELTGKPLVLALGDIGNYDITYVNGVEVGRTGKAELAAKAPSRRGYTIPANLLKAGRAVIAVRTFNNSGPGGIRGFPEWQKRDIGFSTSDNKKTLLSLNGPWKYKVGNALSPRGITADTFSHKLPTGLFNAMVAPVVPFGIRGVAWYQGEQNTGNAWEYRAQFPLMIRDWRAAWGEDMPFLYVQLPGLGGSSKNPTDDSQYNESWNELRDAQWRGLTEPRTAMVTTIDLGDGNIHPANKHDVGARLALAARAVALGEKIEYSGPLYAGFKVESGKVRVKFTHTGSGLTAKDAPDGELARFAIAGADRTYVWAEARIEGDEVVVWNDAVPAPVAVSYAWAINPDGANLYNKDGLPAAPFRSDDWPMRTLGKKAPY